MGSILPKPVFFVVMLFLFFSAHAETVKMGYFELIPHLYQDPAAKAPAGAAVDYFETVAAEMNLEVEWVGPLPFPRLIEYLKSGTIDGSLMINRNPEREVFLHFSERPYFEVQSVMALKADNPLSEIRSPEDVDGFKIGFLKGAHMTPFLAENRDRFELNLLSTNTWLQQNLQQLLLNRLDAVYDLNQISILYQSIKLGMEEQIKILPLPEPSGAVHVVFSRRAPDSLRLVEEYDRIVDESAFDYQNGFVYPMLNEIRSQNQ